MSNNHAQEEISIKELFGLFLKLWGNLVQLFLKAVLFVIKHAIPLVLLIAIGVGVAYFYKESNPRYKRTFIISATEYSGELLANSLLNTSKELISNNTNLKEKLSFPSLNFDELRFQVEPIYNKGSILNRDELQYLEYITENKLVDKSDKERMFEWSNTAYEVEMISPKDIDDVAVLESILNYVGQDSFSSQLHKELLKDINTQIQSNNQMISALGQYVANLGSNTISEDGLKGLVLDGGSDFGTMLFARLEVQRANTKLIAEKVKLEENYRILYKGNATDYYGAGIMSKKALIYPFILVFAYLFIIFVIYIIRAALALKEELKLKEA